MDGVDGNIIGFRGRIQYGLARESEWAHVRSSRFSRQRLVLLGQNME